MQGNPIHSLGVLVLLVFVFLAISRAHEIFSFGIIRPFLILSPFVAVLMLLGGDIRYVLGHRIGKAMVLLTVWILAAIPFSLWRGGSVMWLRDRWIIAVLAFFAVASLTATIRQLHAVMASIAYAILLITVSSAMWGVEATGGRFSLGAAASLSNPNDFACYLLFGVAFLGLPMLKQNTSGIRKFAAALSIALIVLMTLKSGSRMAILTLGFLSLVVFWRLSLPKKLLFVLAIVPLSIGGTAMMSQQSRERILTIFSSSRAEAGTMNEASAIESTLARRRLFWVAVRAMVRHPVFGVGPGVFQVYSSTELSEGTTKVIGAWNNVHNSYAQIGAEAGVPAFLAYLSVIVISVRISLRTYGLARGRPELSDLSSGSVVLLFALASYGCTSMFSNFHDGLLLPVLAGMAVALDRLAGEAVAGVTPAPVPAAVPVPAFGARRRG